MCVEGRGEMEGRSIDVRGRLIMKNKKKYDENRKRQGVIIMSSLTRMVYSHSNLSSSSSD